VNIKKIRYDIKPTKVYAIQCFKCEEIIYSRAQHDFHYCHCGSVAIDGGLEYTRIIFNNTKPKGINLTVDASPRDLYDDWNNRKEVYGWVKPKKRKVKKSVKKVSRV
jgi:hypothetical protein